MIRPYKYELVDDGTSDTVIRVTCIASTEMRFSQETAVEYRDDETGELDFDRFIAEVVDPAAEEHDGCDLFDL